jgi:hypothetical protein
VIVEVSTTPDADAPGAGRAGRTDRIVTCRYIKQRSNRQCTAEAVDPTADVLLCGPHTARVVEHYMAAIATLNTEETPS